MTSNQKNWDAALIKTWRTSAQLLDAIKLFKTLAGKDVFECVPPVKRIPKLGTPWKIGVKSFVATYLPLISDRLWSQSIEKDVFLLRKLETSGYDTHKSKKGADDVELQKTRREVGTNKQKIEFTVSAISKRNQKTDWNVTKGIVKRQSQHR
tara:strand:- start:117 stop:572 length:456 start_codon:yes stop_codon:yes gene_type:complete